MTRERKKTGKTFSMRTALLDEIRAVAAESGVSGGMSMIVEDAVSAWLTRYRSDPKVWLLSRGLPVASKPSNDDL